MKTSQKTEVVVVGAGPVGMFTALRLAELGIRVQIIDQESRTAGHSYACALHPSSLALLNEAGIAADAIKLGRRIDRIRYSEGKNCELELSLTDLKMEFPFVLALPQSGLEDLLEQRLKQLPNVTFHWLHRLTDLRMVGDGVTATIDKLGFTGGGYSVPHMELGVEKEVQIQASYLIGTDGHDSMVRRRLEIAARRVGVPELFAVYEMETREALEPEPMNVVLDESTASVMWPLGERRCRWGFQVVPADSPEEFAAKERPRFIVQDEPGADSRRSRLEDFLSARAPWFKAGIANLTWSAEIQFEHWSASQFGWGRCFLAGDAAHQTGPVGMQSMNRGLAEGEDLAGKLCVALQEGDASPLTSYDAEHRRDWEGLLNPVTVRTTERAGTWVRKNCARIPSTLPLSGRDAGAILNEIGIVTG